MPRPSKLTPDVQQDLIYALTEGASIEHACDYAGIAPSTYYDWMQRGEAGEEGFAEFSEASTRARGRGVVHDLRTISDAVQAGNWKAAAWRLQHRYPQEYGAKLKIQGDADNPLKVIHEMPPEQLQAKITALLAECGYGISCGAGPALPAATDPDTPEET